MEKKTLYTAIKPTGILTLGGFIGVGQTLQSMCEDYNSYICVADLHALTINPNPAELRSNSYKLIAFYLALGLDPDKCTLYLQSQVKEHAEDIKTVMDAFSESSEFGTVLRAKGIVNGSDGSWIHFDYVPGETDIRSGSAAIIGRLCIIGADLDEDKIRSLFGV